MKLHLDLIPRNLQERPQWVGFNVKDNRKVPRIADCPSRNASSTDRSTWRPFHIAAAGVRHGAFDAVAYALAGDYIGIDLDDCCEGDRLNPAAAEIVARCQSYAETSFSGLGVHILLGGTLPGGRGRRVNGVELYDRSRFFITTGNRLPDTPAEIRANPEAVAFILGDVTEKAELTEQAEAISLSSLSFSVLSVTSSPDDVILNTTPKRPGERNRRLLDLARGLRFNARMGECLMPKLKPIVRRWHDAAAPIITTKDFDSTWADFCYAWPRARLPLGVDVLTVAWERSQTDPAPAAAADYDSDPVRRLVCLCAALARCSPDSRFFLSTHGAGRLLKVSPMQIFRWIKMLIADGVLEITHPGDERRATRYRWTPGATREGEPTPEAPPRQEYP